MARSKGRAGRPYRRACAELRASPAGRTCWLCGQPIDLNLDARDPMSWTADHVDPLSHGGAEVDLANLRPAHRRCNSSRGNRDPWDRLETSRAW